MVQTDILNRVNENGRFTYANNLVPYLVPVIALLLFRWQASNYSDFWGKSLDEGIRYRLGTLFPTRTVQNMNDILIEPASDLPERFDAREKWPNYIHPVRDQGNCGASWAFSTTGKIWLRFLAFFCLRVTANFRFSIESYRESVDRCQLSR